MEDFLKKVRNGGVIISTNELSVTEIDQARACDRLFVDEDGFGYVYFPNKEKAKQ